MSEARQLFVSGNYAECVAAARAGVADSPYSRDWQALLIESLLTVGKFEDAQTAATDALRRGYASLPLRWSAYKAFRSNGQTVAADKLVDDILEAASSGRVGDAESLVVIGRAALAKGVEPKLVLDRMYNTAKRFDPKSREVYLAIGELALEKHDYALAANRFQEGLQQLPDDPDLHFGLAQAYAPSEQAFTIESLEAALKLNTNHVPSLLLLADHSIDAERYDRAAELLDRVDRVNPWHTDAWSYRAVLAHLKNQPDAEQKARDNALKFWRTNPRVDHLIGQKLSQKYRFAEGSEHQRRALMFDPDYLPAKSQLAQDLLRLGQETEGWQLAREIQNEDGYDVTANNLMKLHDTMAKYEVLTNAHFIVRMTPHEAALYGKRVLDLLDRARERLCTKYGWQPQQPVLVEVFTSQQDFAVRTFGLPHNDGFLGVCFGPVITANSPAGYPGTPFNWEAMLWHEFCHVVTLHMTRNKMPRWLSEGISVYEEWQANPAWGEKITPTYREMILGEGFVPVSELSAAFLMPPSPEHLQFAYYESALVVQFLIEKFGFEKLRAILRDLADGTEINEAIQRHTAPMETVEKDFEAYAKAIAEKIGPGLDWTKPDLRTFVGDSVEAAAWKVAHPTNFYVLTDDARKLVEEEKWAEAKPILQRLLEACPEFTGSRSAYRMLAMAHRELGKTNEECRVLTRFAERDDSAADVYLRLAELARAANDWPDVLLNANRYRAVNPLVPVPYRFLAEAAENLSDSATAIEARRALVQLDPPDPADAHFRLAKLLHAEGDPAARRQVLMALEEAPRYREALWLLLEINKKETAAAPAASAQ